MVHKRYTSQGQGQVVGTVALDLRRPFDVVNFEILRKMLEMYKCNKDTINWFSSYLKERYQYVKRNNCQSDIRNVTLHEILALSVSVKVLKYKGPTLH